jgi:hypothetical protein
MKRSLRFGISAIIFGLSMMSLPALAGDGGRYERHGGYRDGGHGYYGHPGRAHGWHKRAYRHAPAYVYVPTYYAAPRYYAAPAYPRYYDSDPQVSLSFSISGPLR